MTIKNTSAERLNVVLPPGLVASSAVGQAGGGGGGGGGGFQSMGLGAGDQPPGRLRPVRRRPAPSPASARSPPTRPPSRP